MLTPAQLQETLLEAAKELRRLYQEPMPAMCPPARDDMAQVDTRARRPLSETEVLKTRIENLEKEEEITNQRLACLEDFMQQAGAVGLGLVKEVLIGNAAADAEQPARHQFCSQCGIYLTEDKR